MNTPKLSVLMPAYNAEKYIAEAIESILNQTFTDFEFIIVDDGSTDGTWRIIQRYAEREGRMKVFRHETNMGVSRSRNDLVDRASGQYIVWQDADDISLSYRLGLQYEYMERHPDVGISGGYLVFFSGDKDLSVRTYGLDDEGVRRSIFRFSPLSQGAAIIRKTAIQDVASYKDGWIGAEDLCMSFQIGEKFKFGNIPYILLRYRIQSESATFRGLRRLELLTLLTRWRFSQSSAYKLSLMDIVYNLIQFLSLYLMPIRLRIWIFNRIRNKTMAEPGMYYSEVEAK